MKATTYDLSGKSGAQKALPADVFDGAVNRDVLHQVVTAVLAHKRQGTASTKNRAKMTSGSRKPWRQKGTGRARAGTIRSPLWRGGAVVFGPQPRSYSPKVPKQLRRIAVRSALNARAIEGDLALLEALEFETPKTSGVAGMLDGIGADGNVIILTAGHKPNVYLSARNLPGVRVLPWGEASAYDILWSDLVLIESSSFDDSAPAATPDTGETADVVAGDATDETEIDE